MPGKSPILDTVEHVAGYGVGALGALASLKGGGFQNYLLNRQRSLADPAFRATLIDSPFTSGALFQGLTEQPAAAPGTMPAAGSVAGPSDLAFLAAQTPGGHSIPTLSPLSAEQQVGVQAAQGVISGLQSTDPLIRGQSKVIGKIPLTGQEQGAVIEAGKKTQGGLGPGGTVGVEIPGSPVTIGSPYSVSPVGFDEFSTYGEALAAAQLRGSGWTVVQTNRGTFKPMEITAPSTPPAAGTVTPGGATTPPPATVAPTRPRPSGVTPPGYGATKPPTVPTPPQQTAPTPQRTPAPQQPPVQTGTPRLSAGGVELPAPPPPAPAYGGGPYDPNAIATPPRAAAPSPAPQVGYPSGAFDDTAAPGTPPPQPAHPVYPAQGFVFHHSGGTTLQGLRATLGDRGLGSEYLMDRDGTIYDYAGAGSPHIQPNDKYGGIAPGLTNRNAVGMELVARNDADVTPAQVAAANNFIGANYPNTPVYGHGEVNPGHKEATEGMTVVNAIRSARGAAAAPAGVAGPGFLSQAVSFFGPASAQAAEVPGWAPAPMVATAPQPAAATPPPDLSAPQYAAPPPPPPPQAPADRPGVTVAPGVPAGNAPLPLTGKHYTSASGETDVYELGPPSELAADAADAGITDFRYASRKQLDYFNYLRQQRIGQTRKTEEDWLRDSRSLTESERNATQYLVEKRNALHDLYRDFPDQAERDSFIGWAKRPYLEVVQKFHENPRFKEFYDDLSPFQDMEQHSKMLQEGGVNIDTGKVPTGYEDHASQFETRLDDFNFDLNRKIYLQSALRQSSAKQLDDSGLNAIQTYFDALQDQRVAAKRAAEARARAAATGVPTDTGPTITVAPPTTTTQPPAQGPGGFAVLGDLPQ